MKKKLNHFYLFFLFAVLFLSSNVLGQEAKKVLFIGNSYTAVNNLPSVFSDLANSQNKQVYCEAITPGGTTFYAHLNSTGAVNKIREGSWDYIILQGQSQEVAFPDGQFMQQVYPFAKQLDSIAKAYNPQTRVIFYMTWGYRYGDPINCQFYEPFCTFESMSERLRDNYTLMAQDFHSDVSPVGAAWLNSWQTDSTIVLHSSDNSHPNINGTYLAACCFYEIIFKDSLSNAYYPASIDINTANYLQNIATQTTYNNLSLWCYTNTASDTTITDTTIVDTTTSSLNRIEENKNFDFSVYNSNGNITIQPQNVTGKAILEVFSSEGRLLFSQNIILNNTPQTFTYAIKPSNNVIIVRLTTNKGTLSKKIH